METINIAAYKFIGIPEPASWREPIRDYCKQLGLLGTVLLAPEGINLILAGSRQAIDSFVDFLRSDEMFEGRFSDIPVKESFSKEQPFRKMLVRLKKEIITMKHPTIAPEKERAPAVEPKTLKKWLDQGHDDSGRKLLLLDTRNDYEVEAGTFEGALDLDIEIFSEFPEAWQEAAKHVDDLENKTIVSFCTGGIRCEKAALFMREKEFKNVVQLDGGILRYFEEVGAAHWKNDCFVFDERRAVDPNLCESKKQQPE